jgi:hypothetical protein
MTTTETVDDVLEHFGVKGMRWGVRRFSSGRLGGTKHEPSEDFQKVTDAKKKIRTSGTKALSNQELKLVVERMNLEQQFSNLTNKQNARSKIKNGTSMVRDILSAGNTINEVAKFSNSAAGQHIAKSLKRK